MRIAILTTHLHPIIGGIEVHCLNLGKSLAYRNHDVTVYGSLEPDQDPEMREERLLENLTVKRIPAVHWAPLRRLSRFANLRRSFFEDHCPSRPFSIVHAHQIWPVGVAAAALARWANARLIVTEHGSVLDDQDSLLKRWAMRWACTQASSVLTASRELAKVVRGIGVPGHKVSSMPNAIWPEEFQVLEEKGDVRSRLNLPRDAFVAMTVRRLVPKNGVQYLVRAVAQCVEVIPRFILVVVGHGTLRKNLEQIACELGVSEHVRFVGLVDNHEVKYFMRAADLGVFPSLAEATSIAALEFMATGTPVVASTVGGLPEIIEEGVTGFLFDMGFTDSKYADPGLDPTAVQNISQAVIRAANSDLGTIGRAAAQNVSARFSWESYVEQLETRHYGLGQ